LNSKKLEDKLEYQRNTALAKTEVRRRQRLSGDKFVTNLEPDTYRTQPKVNTILKQISKDVKQNSTYSRKHKTKNRVMREKPMRCNQSDVYYQTSISTCFGHH